jgi:predicted membrane metal-binding protein
MLRPCQGGCACGCGPGTRRTSRPVTRYGCARWCGRRPPAYPGAWDLQRDAWFNGHGGSGYALGPVERVAAAASSGPLRLVQQLRETIARRVTAVVPGPAGAISVTLLTGVTTGIPPPDHDAFRASGLAHLLAVAGLHIGIVMGWVLAFTRIALAAWEHASLHWPAKQLAALAAAAHACEGGAAGARRAAYRRLPRSIGDRVS